MKPSFSRIKKAQALDFMRRFEHLGNVGLGVWHWGITFNGRLESVVSYGVPSFSPDRGWLADLARENDFKVLQLCRGGTRPDAPRNSSSRLIGYANKQIRRLQGDCFIVSYADEGFNEIGTIYQASNFYYCGKTNPKDQSNYLIGNEIVSGWQMRKRHGTRDMQKLRLIYSSILKIPLSKKHIYLSVQTGPRRKRHVLYRLGDRVMDYPKREMLGMPSMDVRGLIGKRHPERVEECPA